MPTVRTTNDATRTIRLLLATRFVRSIGQGALAVDFVLYLRALDWSPVSISAVLSAALLGGVILTLFAGPLSDRGGRRRFLFVYEGAQFLAGLVALLSPQPAVLTAAAMVGGFGRGGNGAAGPFAPVEQAWLAQAVMPNRRGAVYSLNAALGFLGNAIGAIGAVIPSGLHPILPGALAYRPLFLLWSVGSLVCCGLIALTPDREATETSERRQIGPGEHGVEKRENRLVLRLMMANVLNGVGVGATGPLIAYWFAVRFGKGPAEIGPLMAGGFLMVAIASLGAGWLSRWLGMVRVVIAMRLVGLVLLIALPLAPSFAWAASLYVLRGVFNRSTTGARSALTVSIVRAHRRGFAASMANVSMQVPRSVSPVLTGFLFAANDLALPFLIGAAFQGAYLALYYWTFHQMDADVVVGHVPVSAPDSANTA
ncbi:MAG TPA: MFS transporter [Acetobacteraceae bacterium]|nr:MFS transporter [Acetobacteraceae bacterium]